MVARTINILGIIFGIIAFPSLFRNPSVKLWLPLFLINGFNNHLFNKVLVTTKKLKYPVRLFPKRFKINVIYDYLVCPYLSIWYCQSTYNATRSEIFGKLFLWVIPQGAYEILLEQKTNTLKFKDGWKWFHSLFLVFVVKLLSRGILGLLKRTRFYV